MSYEAEIQKLENTKVAGFFGAADKKLWGQADELILDEDCPMPIRIRALAVVDRITGDKGELNAAAVEEYVAMVGDLQD